MYPFPKDNQLGYQSYLLQNEFLKEAEHARLVSQVKLANQTTRPGWKKQFGQMLIKLGENLARPGSKGSSGSIATSTVVSFKAKAKN